MLLFFLGFRHLVQPEKWVEAAKSDRLLARIIRARGSQVAEDMGDASTMSVRNSGDRGYIHHAIPTVVAFASLFHGVPEGIGLAWGLLGQTGFG